MAIEFRIDRTIELVIEAEGIGKTGEAYAQESLLLDLLVGHDSLDFAGGFFGQNYSHNSAYSTVLERLNATALVRPP